MKKLLQLEFVKYSRLRLFYVFIGLFIAIILLSELLTINLGLISKSVKFGYPDAWQNLLYVASWLNFFLGMVALFSITTEYQYKTFRQHIVDGINKSEVFMAKYLYAIGLAIFALVFVSITVIILSLVYSKAEDSHDLMKGSALLGTYFVQMMGYLSMAMFFAFLFRNTILAVLVYLFYMPIESIIGVLLFHSKTNATVPLYFPKNLFSSMVPKPSVLTAAQKLMGISTDGPSESTILWLAIFYIILFTAGSWWLFQKRDL